MDVHREWSLSIRWFIGEPLKSINLFNINRAQSKISRQMKIYCLFTKSVFSRENSSRSKSQSCINVYFGRFSIFWPASNRFRFHTFSPTRTNPSTSSLQWTVFHREKNFSAKMKNDLFALWREFHENEDELRWKAISCQKAINFPRVLWCENCQLIWKQTINFI